MLIYQDGAHRLQVRLDGQTVWLTQAAMAELYQSSKQNISLHLQNIFEEQELQQDSVVKEYLTTAADGKRYRTLHYNLDAVLAIGYRVRSSRGTLFRQWATARLSDLRPFPAVRGKAPSPRPPAFTTPRGLGGSVLSFCQAFPICLPARPQSAGPPRDDPPDDHLSPKQGENAPEGVTGLMIIYGPMIISGGPAGRPDGHLWTKLEEKRP